LIDPVEKWIEAFELPPTSQWALVGVFAGEEGARIRPFDAIELPMPKLWGR
jgi:predicted metal-dependent enzyme (double-stranded beta helix superfamily)